MIGDYSCLEGPVIPSEECGSLGILIRMYIYIWDVNQPAQMTEVAFGLAGRRSFGTQTLMGLAYGAYIGVVM